MGLFQLTAGAASFVNTFAAPIALMNIGYYFYMFFAIFDLFEFAIIYLFFVETAGRTLGKKAASAAAYAEAISCRLTLKLLQRSWTLCSKRRILSRQA